jgi:prolycopene isomerase
MRKLNEAARAMTGLIGGDPKASLKTIAFKPWVMNPVIKYYNKTLDEMLDDFTDDQKLIAVFTQLAGFAGGEPDTIPALFFGVMWTSYHFGGYYYFEGGSQSVSNALARVIRENGGKIMLGTLVTKIIIEDGRATGVETSGGDKFDCRYVVSNANAPATFFELVGEEHLPADYVARIKSMKVGLSTFVVYMGVDKDYSDCFQGGPHEVMVNVGYDQAENFRYMREGEADKFSYAVVNYSMVDKTAAPPGKNVICITAIMPYDHLGDWRESESYEAYRELKEEIAMVLVKRAESLLPGLSEHIEVMEVGTPRTMEHFTLNPGGSIFGWDNTMDQSLLKRLPQKTPIENLYLAGAWTFPGGGQSAVLSSGLSAAAMIVKADKKK